MLKFLQAPRLLSRVLRTTSLCHLPVFISCCQRPQNIFTTNLPLSIPNRRTFATMAPVERLADSLEAPEIDDRSYRVIKLPNKLEALLVHDPDTDKASASVNVQVGSFSDADDMPGMAHAVEHLLFMGTEKYPVENEYSSYLSANSGYSNAYTAAMETNYFFEVAASNEKVPSSQTNGTSNGTSNGVPSVNGESKSPLHGALDRFAQFFISPLFLSETLDRELRAVDSENKKNLQSDNWRFMQLDRSLSNTKHPYHHFSTGNLQTLRDEPLKRGVEIRKEFMDFHDKHYSANRMKLVVLGQESLEQLESWVVELFSGVKNKDLPMNRWPDARPYGPEDVMKQISAKPVMDTRSLDFSFAYQNEELLYETHPSRYLSHLIGHEGPGSILAYIKAKGWANTLSAGGSNVCPDSGMFHISIKLTPEGLKEYEKIVEILFQYIALIKESAPQKWIVDELKVMGEVDFRFKEKSPATKFTSRLSSVMQKPLPREWLLSGDRLIRHFDSKAISQALDCLKDDNYRLTIVSKEFPGDWNRQEKWYGTEYKIEDVSEDLQNIVRKAIRSTASERPSELHLPHKNEFIPTRLSVEKKEITEPTIAPKLIRNEVGFRTWFKKDDRFWVPKGSVVVGIRNPLVAVTPANSVKAMLFTQLVKDSLNEYSYDAEISGLDYSFDSNTLGVSVDISGYNDKMPVLLEKVLVAMRDIVVKSDRFQIVKERLMRGFQNWQFQQPYLQADELTKWLGNSSGWTNEQCLAELPHVTTSDVQAFIPLLLHQVHIEMLVHGNLYKEDALRISDLVDATLRPRPLPLSQWSISRNFILPPGSDYTYRRTLSDPANVNNCIQYYLFAGGYADESLRAKVLLLAQLSDEKGFDTLRTKEQLGYIVFTGARVASSTLGYRVIIQSERTPEYLEERINAFLVTFGTSIREMSDEEFEGHKRSVINRRLEKLKSLDQEATRFWNHISSGFFHFKQVDSDVEHISALTKKDILEFFDRYIDPQSENRAKISVHMVAQSNPKEVAGSLTKEEQVEKVIGVISKYLTAGGIEADTEKLSKHLADTTILEGDGDAIVAAIKTYLLEDGKVPEEQATQLLAEAAKLLGTVLPSLGISLKVKTDEILSPAPKVKETTYIEDVAIFKASLALSAAPRPVVDLSEYEELEPKL